MKFITFALGFLLPILLLSCMNANKETKTENSETDIVRTSQKHENDSSTIDREAIISRLQGKWREPEYPFGVALYKDTLVKFIEEGVVEEPRFREYEISKECPFEVNNIKNVRPDDIILVVAEAGTCEKLQISNDTLTLSGFNMHTGREYDRIYKKVE